MHAATAIILVWLAALLGAWVLAGDAGLREVTAVGLAASLSVIAFAVVARWCGEGARTSALLPACRGPVALPSIAAVIEGRRALPAPPP